MKSNSVIVNKILDKNKKSNSKKTELIKIQDEIKQKKAISQAAFNMVIRLYLYFRANSQDFNNDDFAIEYNDEFGSPRVKLIDVNNRFKMNINPLKSMITSNMHNYVAKDKGKFLYEISKLQMNKMLLTKDRMRFYLTCLYLGRRLSVETKGKLKSAPLGITTDPKKYHKSKRSISQVNIPTLKEIKTVIIHKKEQQSPTLLQKLMMIKDKMDKSNEILGLKESKQEKVKI